MKGKKKNKEKNKIPIVEEHEMVRAILIDGEIAELVKKTITLSEADKEIMLSPESKRWVLRKRGNLKLIAATGISIINPEYVWVHGHKMMNPYSDLDEKGNCRGGYMHSMAVGYSPSGQLVGVSCTISYLVDQVRKSALIQTIKNFPDSGFNALSKDDIPDEYIDHNDKKHKVNKKKKWKYFEIDSKLGGIQVDTMHPAVFNVRDKLLADVTYMDTTLERRILTRVCQSHPAINMSFVESSYIEHIEGETGNDTIAKIPIYLCKRSLPEKRLLEIQEAVTQGLTFIPSDIKVISHVEAVSQEEEEENIIIEEESETAERLSLIETIENNLEKYYSKLNHVIGDRELNMYDLTIEELKKIIGEGEEKWKIGNQ